jgi:hypothetical protein
MIRIVSWKNVLLAGIAGGGALVSQLAVGSVDNTQLVAGPQPAAAEIVGGTADLEMRFIQEDGPDSGHIRVVLTPETQALTAWEARSAAQQAFLEALGEPALGGSLSRITVVVRLMPHTQLDPGSAEQVFRFLFKGGKDWTILPPE